MVSPEPSPSAHLRRLSDEASASLHAKRLIFTVTSGRTGSDFLARIAALIPGVDSRHEPFPNFDTMMRRVQLGVEPDLARRWFVEEKLPAIAQVNEPVYLEASHVFCKGFFEPLLELGFTPALVILTRASRDTAKSIYSLGTIPGRVLRGDRWYLRPDDPGVLPLPGWEQMHDYQICYWYTLEIARRQDRYEAKLSEIGGDSLRTTARELSTIEGFEQLCQFATGESPSFLARRRFKRLAGRPTNTKAGPKSVWKMELPNDLESLEHEVHEAIDRA